VSSFEAFRHDPRLERRPAGDVIFHQGDPGDTMYVVVEGDVTVEAGDRRVLLAGPGTVFGEMALIDAEPRSATARAQTDVAIVPVDRRRFLYLVENTPYFALEVLRTLSRRVREMNATT
jgi:CRP-like cAMP-binding protein